MSSTSKGSKYHPCPTPPTKTRRVFTFSMSLAEIVFWMIFAIIILAAVGKWLGVQS